MPQATASTLPPQWSLTMLHAKQRKPPVQSTNGFAHAPDAPPVTLRGDALERWYGRLYEPTPAGKVDRSYSLWWLAVVLLEAGCSPVFVEELIAERDASLGWTAFTERRDKLVRYHVIVERAVASKGPQRIRLSAAATPVAAAPQRESLHWQTVDQFNASEDEDVAWTAVGVIGDGLITELDGKAKRSGKTTLLLGLSRAILHGEPFLGQPTSYSTVVYLTEQSGPSFKRSLRRSGLVDGDAFHLLLWGDTEGWTWEQLIPEVLVKCEQVGARVLIVDTLAQFSGVRGDSENHSGAALEVMEPLQAATRRPLGILISRHDRKAGGTVGDSGRGSSAFAGAVDIILHLDRPEPKPGNERQRVLEGLSRFEETPDNVMIELAEEEPQAYRTVGNVDEIKSRDLREEILACLPTTVEDAISRKDLLEQVAGRAIDVARVLKQLLFEQLIVLDVRGKAHFFYQKVWLTNDD